MPRTAAQKAASRHNLANAHNHAKKTGRPVKRASSGHRKKKG
jgi:hypothetical protein